MANDFQKVLVLNNDGDSNNRKAYQIYRDTNDRDNATAKLRSTLVPQLSYANRSNGKWRPDLLCSGVFRVFEHTPRVSGRKPRCQCGHDAGCKSKVAKHN